MNYLKPDDIISTLKTLEKRIHERFPDCGLAAVAGNLTKIATEAEKKAIWYGKPIGWLRGLCWAISILIVGGSLCTLWLLAPQDTATEYKATIARADTGQPAYTAKLDTPDDEHGIGWAEFIQLLEAGINDIVLIGAAIFFIVTLESRFKRGKACDSIHELRSIAHIIDMHQLTKDPERTINKKYLRTTNSPTQILTAFQLRRYLDYCSEMLSLTGKIAAVYVQDFSDSVALASVNEVETLCSGLSRKIWQKLSLLQDFDEPDDPNKGTTGKAAVPPTKAS